ncbi:hypothetical protein ADICYQ_4328 [Cyclobacterium qasimii M12-11B]|uniref:Uncharacterized protein n=1 Tax=Cyclobacterium qasimii M12-11B TaxID=641524 RepID=S7VA02_9BACT|nr:hypothetical protein ADICYQ_4328 [Cyclobacterium qasimii M12-11B]
MFSISSGSDFISDVIEHCLFRFGEEKDVSFHSCIFSVYWIE